MRGRGDGRGLAGMIQRGPNELANVVVREGVEDVFPVAAALHDALGVQDAKLLGQGRELGFARVGELGDAALAGIEAMQEPQARQVAGSAKKCRCPFEGTIADRRHMGAVGGMRAARHGALGRGSVCHFNDC